MNSVKYSLIIATYNRIDELKELLASAEMLQFDRSLFEIVFVDDGSADGTEEYIQNYRSPSGLHVLYLYQQNKGPGEARNHGMSKANGEYFIFIDSDCQFPPDYLEQVDTFVEQHKPDAFGGPDTCHPDFSPLLKAINYSMTSFIGTGGTRGSKKSVQKKFYPRSFNMGVSRKVFETIGGMGTLRHGQDMEFSARIYRNGFNVALIPEAFVYHKRRTSLKRFYKQIFNWGVARINLGRIDKSMLKPVHLIPAVILACLVILIMGSVLYLLLKLPLTPLIVLWILTIGGVLLIALLAFFQSMLQYRSLKVSFLSILTLFIQVFAYGAGLIRGMWQVLRGKKTASGFTKNYYK
jgi:glycosyltransferase involved in cell wall biosynthesis